MSSSHETPNDAQVMAPAEEDGRLGPETRSIWPPYGDVHADRDHPQGRSRPLEEPAGIQADTCHKERYGRWEGRGETLSSRRA